MVPDEQAPQNLYDLAELPLQWTGWPHLGVEVVHGYSLDSPAGLADFVFDFRVNSWPPDITQSQGFIPDTSRVLCLQF